MARTPFKLKSGNSTPFKSMGSSPMKKNPKKLWELGTAVYKHGKKLVQKWKKGKPTSTSHSFGPSGKKTKTTTTYKESTERIFYNADGSVKRTSSVKSPHGGSKNY